MRGTIYRIKKEGKGTFNQAINGHDLQTVLRIPKVTDTRAASVHEPSGNNDDYTWRHETTRLLRWALMRNRNHESQAIRPPRSQGSASSLILPGNRVWIKGGLMYGTEIPRPIWTVGPSPMEQPYCPEPFLKLPSCKTSFGPRILRSVRHKRSRTNIWTLSGQITKCSGTALWAPSTKLEPSSKTIIVASHSHLNTHLKRIILDLQLH